MPLINVCVVTTPMTNVQNNGVSEQDIIESWCKTEQGKWVEEHAKEITAHIESSWASESFVIKIIANFDLDSYVAFRLMWPHKNDV